MDLNNTDTISAIKVHTDMMEDRINNNIIHVFETSSNDNSINYDFESSVGYNSYNFNHVIDHAQQPMQQQYQIKHQTNSNIINYQAHGSNNNSNMFRHKGGQLNMASKGTKYFSQEHTQPNIIPSKMHDKNGKSKSMRNTAIGSSTSRTMSTTRSKISKNKRSYDIQSTRTTATTATNAVQLQQ